MLMAAQQILLVLIILKYYKKKRQREIFFKFRIACGYTGNDVIAIKHHNRISPENSSSQNNLIIRK